MTLLNHWRIVQRTATGNDSQFVKHTNQYHPPQGYGYLPSQQPFPFAPQCYHHSLFNMAHISEQITSASQEFQSDGPQWQWHDLHAGGYRGSQMLLYQQIAAQKQSFTGVARVHPGPPGNNPVNWPTSCRSTSPPEPASGEPVRPPLASQGRDSSGQQNHGNQISQGLWTCPHCTKFPTMNMMQLMRAKIHLASAVK